MHKPLLPALTLLVLTEGFASAAGPRVDFSRDIRPILADHCWSCHGPDGKSREAGLRLDTRAGAVASRDQGKPAIVPGNPAASSLVARIEAEKPSRRMPPPDARKPLSDRQKQLLRRWIEEGAEYTQHWAFVPPQRTPAPDLPNTTGIIRNPVDAFIQAKRQTAKLDASPEADRATLLRRLTLDLTGLPPTLGELDGFLTDPSPDAYEKVVERLLASPRYAERMALHWLDAARYADTNGYNNDEERTMWPWRDWVLDAFRRHMPYDQFLTEQLAGDLLPGATLRQKVATGFNRNHVITSEGGIIEEEYRVEYVADRVHTTATVFLGLSMQCARCHDHKFDPLTQREYYQFFAFFNNLAEKPVGYQKARVTEPLVSLPTPAQQAELDQSDKRRMELEHQLKQPKLSEADQKRLKADLAAVNRRHGEIDKAVVRVMVMQEMPKPRDAFVLTRGQYNQRGDKVNAGLPAVLSPTPHATHNRLDLARWLVHPTHPLTARVAVNRWWALYFGTGLVETVEDFGVQGDLPSHPELLDWLASELIRSGWDVRTMQKLIVTSATYRQSSGVTPRQLELDPKNRLLARSPRFRLPAESLRDNALAISGLLGQRLGGPSVKPYQPPGLWEDVSVERREKYVADAGEGLYRRSLYTFWKRTCPPPGMTAFDAPDRETCTIRRARTNTPLQALVLLNDPTYVEAARKLAERAMQVEASPEARLDHAFRLAVARKPAASEQAILLELYREALARFRKDRNAARRLLAVGVSPRSVNLDEAELAAWTTVASMVLNLDETITRR